MTTPTNSKGLKECKWDVSVQGVALALASCTSDPRFDIQEKTKNTRTRCSI